MLISAFFCKKSVVFEQNSTFIQSDSVEAVLERFFSSVFSFRRIKSYCWWRHTFSKLCVWNPVSELLQICHKLEKRQLRHSFGHGDIIKISLRCFDSLATFSFWSKFHVNTVTSISSKWVNIFISSTENFIYYFDGCLLNLSKSRLTVIFLTLTLKF